MNATLQVDGHELRVDFSKPIDISIPLNAGLENVNAWYCEPVRIEPVRMGDWVGDVNSGGSVNFRNIHLNPHGNGTHTECMGHISKEEISLNQELKSFFFVADLVSVTPISKGDDLVITMDCLSGMSSHPAATAIIIRTLPNDHSKRIRQYSNSNPPYIDVDLMRQLVQKGIKHLLLDLPSVDRERDEGRLEAHHAFWQYPDSPRSGTTITELIFVPDDVADGSYLLNLMVTSLENDASPSKPILYSLF
ncbi:MAG: cyclase family protein [Arcticibacter sp.]